MTFGSSEKTLDEKGAGCSAGIAAISTVPWLWIKSVCRLNMKQPTMTHYTGRFDIDLVVQYMVVVCLEK